MLNLIQHDKDRKSHDRILPFVIPAQAGIQKRHRIEGRAPRVGPPYLDSRLRGNDEGGMA
ncbi:hypothetical protein [Aquisediminimonas sediminicola]|uniref:hypothetical protein n=1 Tax=Alteraquisediminimonas sediminicola TaxID=2676787 RepID=UPI001C8DE9C4|nr:hypothetical protein [Aquisediminimonas sediminicola]